MYLKYHCRGRINGTNQDKNRSVDLSGIRSIFAETSGVGYWTQLNHRAQQSDQRTMQAGGGAGCPDSLLRMISNFSNAKSPKKNTKFYPRDPQNGIFWIRACAGVSQIEVNVPIQ